MVFRILADATLVLHVAFVGFVLLGGLLVLRRPRLAWAHVPAVLWAAWVELAGSVCPLTPLENWLREQGGEAAYGSGFVEHYLLPLLYPDALSREIQSGLGVVVLALNAAVYILALHRRRLREGIR